VWSIGRFDLRLTDEQFWRLTPKEYAALIERWRQNQDLEFQRMGTIAALIQNAYRGKGKALTPADFNPFTAKKISRRKKTSPELLKTIETINRLMGGSDSRGSSR